MLKSCHYCGRVHEFGEVCSQKPKPQNKYRHSDQKTESFRSSRAWQKKRSHIKKRDQHLCQACIRRLQGTLREFNNNQLSVHHIEEICSAYEKRLDDNNLITLCSYHHKQADNGKLSALTLKRIALEQEAAYLKP